MPQLTVTLEKEQWEFILEVIDLNNTVQIKGAAFNLLKPKLEQALIDQQNIKKE